MLWYCDIEQALKKILPFVTQFQPALKEPNLREMFKK